MYALLAVLIADENVGARTNVILTTNFDDLVADALYLLDGALQRKVEEAEAEQRPESGRSADRLRRQLDAFRCF